MKQKFKFTPTSYNVKEMVKRTEDILTIIRFYTEETMTLHEIADMFGMSYVVVYDILLANDVKLRPRGRNR